MRVGALLVSFGCLAVLGALAMYVNDRHILEQDRVDIGRMRVSADSSRAQLARATNAAESTALGDQIRGREAGIARREFHVPLRQERVTSWWRPTGSGSLSAAVGALLIVLGFTALRRRKGVT